MNKNINLLFILLLSVGLCFCNKEDYFELEDGLYVNHLPGFYSEGFDLKFKSDYNTDIYYWLFFN